VPAGCSFSTTHGRLAPWSPIGTAAASFCVVALLAVPPIPLAAQQRPDPTPVPAGGPAARPEQFAGTWSYNSEDSRNIATGRPERGAPGSVPPRPIVPRAAPATREGNDSDGRNSPFAPSPQLLRENRDLSRDLLEIAEALTFAVTPEAVTITDDLDRERTFPVDNRRQRYRLGASEFFARVRWDDGRLLREIEGTFGFRMTETYFLSPGANRLFVIIRVGEPTRGRAPVGADRVYDRVNPEEQ
jgi:hypothetical protein